MTLTAAPPIALMPRRDPALTQPVYTNVRVLTLRMQDDQAAVYHPHGLTLRLKTLQDHAATPHNRIGRAVPDLTATDWAPAAKGVRFNIYPGFAQDDLGIWTSPDGDARIIWFNDPKGRGLNLTQS